MVKGRKEGEIWEFALEKAIWKPSTVEVTYVYKLLQIFVHMYTKTVRVELHYNGVGRMPLLDITT